MAHATPRLKIPPHGTGGPARGSPLYVPLLPAWETVRACVAEETGGPSGTAGGAGADVFPSLGALAAAFERAHPRPLSGCGIPLRPVAPAPDPRGRPRDVTPATRPEGGLEMNYQARLFLKGELITRPRHWHDLFGALTHMAFPRAKATLNARQFWEIDSDGVSFPYGTGRGARRNPRQDLLTHFDEGGLVIACSDAGLVRALRARRWKEVFWRRREGLPRALEFLCFGHAVYEQFLYGVRDCHAGALAVEVEPRYFDLPLAERLARIDAATSLALQDVGAFARPSDLFPVPLLGYPGFCERTASEAYYDEDSYFRPW